MRASELAFDSEPRAAKAEAGAAGAYFLPCRRSELRTGPSYREVAVAQVVPHSRSVARSASWRGRRRGDSQASPPMARPLNPGGGKEQWCGLSQSCPWGIHLSRLQIEFAKPLLPLVASAVNPSRTFPGKSWRKTRAPSQRGIQPYPCHFPFPSGAVAAVIKVVSNPLDGKRVQQSFRAGWAGCLLPAQKGELASCDDELGQEGVAGYQSKMVLLFGALEQTAEMGLGSLKKPPLVPSDINHSPTSTCLSPPSMSLLPSHLSAGTVGGTWAPRKSSQTFRRTL